MRTQCPTCWKRWRCTPLLRETLACSPRWPVPAARPPERGRPTRLTRRFRAGLLVGPVCVSEANRCVSARPPLLIPGRTAGSSDCESGEVSGNAARLGQSVHLCLCKAAGQDRRGHAAPRPDRSRGPGVEMLVRGTQRQRTPRRKVLAVLPRKGRQATRPTTDQARAVRPKGPSRTPSRRPSSSRNSARRFAGSDEA